MRLLREDAEQCYAHYREMLNEDEEGNVLDPSKSGLARELARMNLTLNTYTQWYWKIDLHNFMHFLSLRADSHAQYEIRVYGEVMQDVLRRWLPLTHEAFLEYRREGAFLSKGALAVVNRLLDGDKVTEETSGLSAREWRELMAILGREAPADD